MTQTSPSEIEAEIIRRISRRHDTAKLGSNMAKAKLKSRAAELADLLGWIRKSNVSDTDGGPLGL